jgi:hypothetical protein
VDGKPSAAGTYSEDAERLRIVTRDYRIGETPRNGGPADIEVRDGRVASIATPSGVPL